MATQPLQIQSEPGICRDGTQLNRGQYVDGRWCRFLRGSPAKMGGYSVVNPISNQRVYGMNSFMAGSTNFVHMGMASYLWQHQLDSNGNFIGAFNRTPAGPNFVPDANNIWQMDVLPQATGGGVYTARLVAHAAPNMDIASEVETEIFYGTVTDTGILIPTALTPVSGGIVSVGPYIVSYGNAGQVLWSAVNDPTTQPIANYAFITQQKIVQGLPLRGSGSGPAALLWSLDSLIRMSFSNDPSTDWNFDTISADISILSSQSVIEYDGVYYWIGVDRFLSFNGVVREVPNESCMDWFFDNVNFSMRQKIFAFKVPRYGEIWWCYPRGSATECTHAIIFNVRYGVWYDTELPTDGRTAGLYAKVFNRPLMCNATPDTTTGLFKLWQHEIGTNAIDGAAQSAIQSYFETADVTLLKGATPTDRSIHVERVEPDFIQQGQMIMTIKGRANARAPEVTSDPFIFEDSASISTEETLKLREIRRQLRFRFESNTLDGYYEMGYPIAHIGQADGRIES